MSQQQEVPSVHRDFPMPAPLAARARSWLAGENSQMVPARPSATVMLLRDTPAGGVEVFVLHRSPTMAFAPDYVAFPGGGVDPRDADPDVPWAGPDPQAWAAALHADEVRARELVIAAAREVFEECGVLLAGPDADSVVEDLQDPSWERDRAELLSRALSFGELLIRRGLVLRGDLLRVRGHWITPQCEPRRYDTRFFVAGMPAGQVADDRSTEAVRAGWLRPATALAEHAQGRGVMLPPTQVMLEQLLRLGSTAEVLDEQPDVRPVQPWPVEVAGQLWMRAPVGVDGHGLAPAGRI